MSYTVLCPLQCQELILVSVFPSKLYILPLKNICKHDICVLSVGEIFRGESLKQCNQQHPQKDLECLCVPRYFPFANVFLLCFVSHNNEKN